MKKFLYNIILVISFTVFLYSAYNIYKIQSEYKKSDNTYENLSQYISIENTEEVKKEIKEDYEDIELKEIKEYPEVNFQALKEINEDVFAWIYLADSRINYPVVKGKDNEYYLNKLVNGKINPSGSIFLDYRNSENFDDKHTIIYGHHMKNGSMFSALTDYKKTGYYEKHKTIYLVLNDKVYEMEVFAGSVCNVEENAWDMNFQNGKEALAWAKDRKNKSVFKSDVELNENDKYISLSTCTYEFDDARFVLLGRLKEIE